MDDHEILDSWKEISDYLKRDARTCQRYERELGLPVHRLDSSPRARVFAYRDEIDAWREKGLKEHPDLLSWLFRFVRSKPPGAVLTLVIVLGLGALLYGPISDWLSGKENQARLTLAVLPSQNVSGQADQNNWTLGIPQLLISSLSGSEYYKVLSYDETYGILKEMNLNPAEEISAADLATFTQKAGATHTIRCSIVNAGNSRVAVLTIRRPGTEEAYISQHDIEGEAGLVKAASRMADRAKRDLGLTRTIEAGDFDALEIPVTTSSPDAFRLYNEARRFYLDNDYPRSLQAVRKALPCDPKFALAWRSLWATLRGLGRNAEAEACIQKALECSGNASTQERLLIKVDYFYWRGEFAKALEACREWTGNYPEDTTALTLTARTHLYMEDLPSAAGTLARSLEKGNRSPYTFYAAVSVLGLLGRFEDAERICEQGLAVHPNNKFIIQARVSNAVFQGLYDKAFRDVREYDLYTLDFTAGEILLLKGDFKGAEKELLRMGRVTERILRDQALLALAGGQYERAAKFASRLKNRISIAYIEARRGRLALGLAEAETALSQALAEGRARPVIRALQVKGWIEAAMGNIEAAEATKARLRNFTESDIQRARSRTDLFLEGLIKGAMGDDKRAIEELAAAIALLPPEGPEYGYGTHAMYLYCAAAASERAGDRNGAAVLYRRILGLHLGRLQYPDLYALSHCALGQLAEAAGDHENARMSYNKFLELWKDADPGLPEVEDAKKRLQGLT